MTEPIKPTGSIQVQDRDLAILRGLFESRVMTARHIASIFFDGSEDAAKKRLQKAKAAGLIGGRQEQVNKPAVLYLTRKGFQILRDNGLLSDYPPLGPKSIEGRARVSDLTLRHELEVMDVKSAFCSAVSKAGAFTMGEFTTWPLLYQFEAYRPGTPGAQVLVKPDGFIRIHERERDGGISEHTFFLEVDRSTETQETLAARACSYLDYYSSGGFAVRNGADRTEYKDYPFRVLMVFKSTERRNNMAARLLQNNPPIFTQVYLSTLPEVMARPLDTVWIRPLDYREATNGTPFDPSRQRTAPVYKRQTAREEFLEQRLLKHRLLQDDSRP